MRGNVHEKGGGGFSRKVFLGEWYGKRGFFWFFLNGQLLVLGVLLGFRA